jgi:hypothetical protein
MEKASSRKGKKIGIAAVFIAIIATISLVVVIIVVPAPRVTSTHAKQVMFSEVQVSGSSADQFVELYTWEAPGSNLAGWKLEHAGKLAILPAITDLGNLSYIVLRFGPGTNDTDAADKNATVYLDLQGTFLGTQGTLRLVDDVGLVVDYINWGDVAPINPVNWLATDNGIIPSLVANKSMQAWGNDQDNSTNWFIDDATPGIANAVNFNVSTTTWGNITVELSNGINFALPALAGGNYRFESEVVVTGTPVPWVSKADITEMADFTLKHYAKLGFMKPYLGPDGKLNIHVSNSSSQYSTGSCDRYGKISINLGQKGGMAGKVGTKYTVEHEIMHAIQAANEGGYDHWGKAADDPFQEGVAAWGGLSSTMKNYNLTWNQTMVYMKEVGKMNWFDHYRDINTTLWPWPTSGWGRYMGMGLFVKFLNETYGNGTLGRVMKGIKTHYNGSVGLDVGATTALENELGISFKEIWRRYQAWLVDGSASKANQFPTLTPHSNPAAPGSSTPTTDGPVTVAPYGSDIEFINCAGKTTRFSLSFGHLDATSEWRITIIYKKADGTTVTNWFTIAGSSAPVPVNPSLWANITIVKTRIGTAGNGSISIHMNPLIDQRDGRSVDNPRWGNCSAAQPTENNTNTVIPDLPGLFFGIWLDKSQLLNIHVKNSTSNDPSENAVGFYVLGINGTLYYSVPPDPDNPKVFMFSPPETQYYIIHVAWIPALGPFPIQPAEILVDVAFHLS